MSPAITLLLAIPQRTRVNNEDRLIRVKDVYDLQEPATSASTLNDKLIVTYLLGKGRSCLPHDHFCFLPIHTMLGNMT